MKPKEINITNILATVGVGYGIFFAVRKNSNLAMTALYMAGFGLAGLIIGNQISKKTNLSK